jgi:hypothetical protein
MTDLVLHIEDATDSLCGTHIYDRVHIVWFEEITDSKTTQRLQSAADQFNTSVLCWHGDTVWPRYNLKFLYYLWISSTDQSVDHSSPVLRHFVCLNNTPRSHRQQFLSEFWDFGLFDHSLVSWADRSTSAPWVTYTEPWLGSQKHPTTVLPVIALPLVEFNQSAFSIVLETNTEIFDISEKTFQCLALGQPFLTYGAVGIYSYLQTMGFRLYPFVDYSFDTIADPEHRRLLIFKQLARLTKIAPEQLKKDSWSVSKYNQLVFKKIVTSLNLPFAKDAVYGKIMKKSVKNLLDLKKLYQ